MGACSSLKHQETSEKMAPVIKENVTLEIQRPIRHHTPNTGVTYQQPPKRQPPPHPPDQPQPTRVSPRTARYFCQPHQTNIRRHQEEDRIRHLFRHEFQERKLPWMPQGRR